MTGHLIEKTMSGIQQTRSYHMVLIEKEDIWDTKNFFRNEVIRIIQELSMQYNSMKDLEENVLEQVKQMI